MSGAGNGATHDSEPLLELRDLKVHFRGRGGTASGGATDAWSALSTVCR